MKIRFAVSPDGNIRMRIKDPTDRVKDICEKFESRGLHINRKGYYILHVATSAKAGVKFARIQKIRAIFKLLSEERWENCSNTKTN